MAQKVLVPIDGSASASKALEFACSTLDPAVDTLVLVHVVLNRAVPDEVKQYIKYEHIEDPPEWVYEQTVGRDVLKVAEQAALAHGIAQVETVVEKGDPAREIVAAARNQNVDMVVMGTRGLSDLQGIVMGSVAHRVCHLAKCTVVTVH